MASGRRKETPRPKAVKTVSEVGSDAESSSSGASSGPDVEGEGVGETHGSAAEELEALREEFQPPR